MFQAFALIVALAAIFSYLNHKFLRLPATIGIMLLALGLSVMLALMNTIAPDIFHLVCQVVLQLDFREILMDIMLSFLLFAGALHVNIKDLARERVSILLFATLGVLISTFLVGGLLFVIVMILGLPIAFIHCLLFGALISPTDPIAVLSILKESHADKRLELKISGESLFNDGIGVVVFVSIMMIAEAGDEGFGTLEVLKLFAIEAIGGLIFGLILGYIGIKMLGSVKGDAKVEVLITVAICMGGYVLASILHLSGPLAMVVAGLMIGNFEKTHAHTHETSSHLSIFWEMLDEILNSVLFVLIGIEVLTLSFDGKFFLAGLIAIPIVLVSRAISIGLPFSLLKHEDQPAGKTIAMLTWGGLRGGISIALALSLNEALSGEFIIFITYMVVVFSIVFQGLSMGKLTRLLKFNRPDNE